MKQIGTRTAQEVRSQVYTASGLNIVAGLWLVIAPYVLDYAGIDQARTNDLIVGLIVAVLASIRVGTPLRLEGLSWVNFVLGGWLILAPFVLGYASGRPLWNDVILGIIVLALAAWSAMATSSARHTTGEGQGPQYPGGGPTAGR